MTLTRIRALLWRMRHLLIAVTFLAALATVLQAINGMQPAVTAVVVAAKQLPAGKALVGDDLVIAHMPTELVPDGALTNPSDAAGEVLVSALPRGMPIPRQLLLSADFLALAPPGEVIVSVTIIGDGTEDLAQPGTSVSVYAPPDDFSENAAAILVAEHATVVGHGKLPESGGLLGDSDNTRVIFLAVPDDAATMILGYGARTAMRVVLNTH
ncbi:MAG: SAF domain-containing protein [Ancrocorticia sp.]